jgi:hypothetical protein
MAKPKSKTQKKIDNNVRLALTDACEEFLHDVPGFQWLTHEANYSDFPASLLVCCVFGTSEEQQQANKNNLADAMRKLVQAKLLSVGVKLKSLKQQIIMDSEEACTQEHEGNWAQRLGSPEQRRATSIASKPYTATDN